MATATKDRPKTAKPEKLTAQAAQEQAQEM